MDTKTVTTFGDADGREDGFLLNGRNVGLSGDGAIRFKEPDCSDEDDDCICETVADVSVNNEKGRLVVYFSVVMDEDGAGKYCTRTYSLSPSGGTLGIFDLLDDYYMRKFKFLYTSRSSQAFLCAIAKAERAFHERSGFSLYDYCTTVSERALKDVLDKVKSEEGKPCLLWNGYSLGEEARSIVEMRRKYIDKGYMEKLGSDIVGYFIGYMKESTKSRFTAVCIHTTEEIPESLFIDSTAKLPLVVYVPDFADALIRKLAQGFFAEECFRNAGIERVCFDVYLVMPNAGVDDLRKHYKADGELKDPDGFKDSQLVIGKYKSYSIAESDIDADELDTVIGYS